MPRNELAQSAPRLRPTTAGRGSKPAIWCSLSLRKRVWSDRTIFVGGSEEIPELASQPVCSLDQTNTAACRWLGQHQTSSQVRRRSQTTSPCYVSQRLVSHSVGEVVKCWGRLEALPGLQGRFFGLRRLGAEPRPFRGSLGDPPRGKSSILWIILGFRKNASAAQGRRRHRWVEKVEEMDEKNGWQQMWNYTNIYINVYFPSITRHCTNWKFWNKWQERKVGKK